MPLIQYACPSNHLALLRVAHARPSRGRARLPGGLSHRGTDKLNRRWQLCPGEVLLLKRGRGDVWSMADGQLSQLGGPLIGTLSIAPMFPAAGSERVDPEPSASALRNVRHNPQMTKGATLRCRVNFVHYGPALPIL